MTACYFCTTEVERPINGNHWIADASEQPHGGHYERVDACSDCNHEGAFKRHPRQPRKPRPQPTTLYGDYAQFALFNRIGLDGSTPKSRRRAGK